MPGGPTDIHPAIQEVRYDLTRFDYAAAIRHASDGLAREDINRIQRERLLLLRADAYHWQQNFERALKDADDAVALTANLSPQAQFIRGRELFAQSHLEEARDAFELAECLMATPTPSKYLQEGAVSDTDRWANLGIAPSTAPSGAPPAQSESVRPVTYEWATDLASWRAVARECATALSVFKTRIVPRNVLTVCQNLVQKRLAAKSSRSLVLLLRNDTTERLVFDFHRFGNGKFLEGCSFPSAVPPMSSAIAGAHATGWMRGVSGVAAFSLHENHVICLSFDCPYVGGFASKAAIIPKNLMGSDGSLPSPSKARTVAAVGGNQYRVTVGPPGYVQTFSICKRNNVNLNSADVAAILDFLPPQTLRKATAVAHQWRRMCSRMPPQRFYGLTRPYPDFRLAVDLERTNWSVVDEHRVRWSIKSEAAFHDERTICFVDANDNRVFFLTCDIFARAVECIMYYGSRKSPVASLEEGFFATAKKTSMKVGGKTVATISWKGTKAELNVECATTNPAFVLDRSSDSTHIITNAVGEEVARLLIHSRTSRRSSTVAELQLLRGSEALFCCVLSFVALFRT
jgi:hypothetical protein